MKGLPSNNLVIKILMAIIREVIDESAPKYSQDFDFVTPR
jgi:hypothetical protein